ncbi:MAG TPA: alpha/beta hydrolase-fold protein [Actinomycetota bacterium]|jgi:enterochelin esterase family protein|nr:alpha/beta hydrolase-fold protein [Actinomycetota bacterium]
MAQPATAEPGPLVGAARVTFRVPDPEAALQEVRLYQEVQRPRVGPAFTRVDGSATWELDFPRPAVDRMEYQLALRYPGAGPVLLPDPGNLRTAQGPFGEKSVIEFPGYQPPAWLDVAHRRPASTGMAVPSRVLGARVPIELWRSPGRHRRGAPLPLLVVHDGPEYARYAALLDFLTVACADGRLPPMRAALLAPVDRTEHYSASPAWSRALVSEVLPALQALTPTPPGRRWLVGMGASLGALATLAAARAAPASFGGLFLQSGSFFRPGPDDHERDFPRFRRITRFVDDLAAGAGAAEPASVALTCGTVEENLHGNRVVRDALAARGWQVSLAEHRDAHNWVAWRDTFDPWLVGLLQELWA